MAPADPLNEGANRANVLRLVNEVLTREGSRRSSATTDTATYATSVRTLSRFCTLIRTGHCRRPDRNGANQLEAYLDVCSSDELIEEVLLPMFRQLGFHRVTAVGHKDKAIEYGKDG